MKIHILYDVRGLWGGGNQFLKALRDYFLAEGIYEKEAKKADLILFNSHHQLGRVIKLKLKHPEKIFIHRLGPIFHYHRGKGWKKYDQLIIKLTNQLSDGVIFQSRWAMSEAMKLGFNKRIPHKVIYNAVDENVFNKRDKKKFESNKIKLLTTNWSKSPTKGFGIYQYLDRNLDFNRYEYNFIGRSPVGFKNIKIKESLPSRNLAEEIKKSDIFVIASEKDACSNSLIEALSCGLPAVALDDGGHPEIVQKGGELFKDREDIIKKIKKVAQNYHFYQSQIPEFSIKKTAQAYFQFAESSFINRKVSPKKHLKKINLFRIKLAILIWRILNKFIT